MPHPTINAIEQDKLGFMWFGTQGGLVKFDGNNSTVYQFSKFEQKFGVSDWINKIYTDSEGRIWVASGKSISMYLPETDSFEHFDLPQLLQHDFNDIVIDIMEDKNNNIWFLTSKSGVFILENKNNKLKRVELRTNNGSFEGIARGFSSNDNGSIVIVTKSNGVFYKSFGSDLFINFSSKNITSWPESHPRDVFLDKEDNIWIGTSSEGLFSFSPTSKRLSNIFKEIETDCSLQINQITGNITEKLWLATNKGICEYSYSNKSIIVHNKLDFAANSLVNNQVRVLTQDEGGVMWVGTQNGISYWNAKFPSFQHINKQSYPVIQSEHTISFTEDKNGNFYIGSFGGGITKFLPDGSAEPFFLAVELKEIIASIVPSLLVDRHNNIWVGTLKNGLYRGELGTDNYKHFVNEIGLRVDDANYSDEKATTINGISRLKELKDGTIAIGTWGGGVILHHFDENGNSVFERLDNYVDSGDNLPPTLIVDIIEDNDGALWFASHHGGLVKFDRKTKKAQAFLKNQTNPQSLQSNSVFGLLSTDEYIWMTTPDAGIARLDKEKLAMGEVVFQHFGSNEGLASDFTYGILQDDDSYIWISHSKGLTRFNPYTLSSVNFNTSHGLQGNDFNSGAFFKASDGRMFFGGANGFNTFLPDQIPINTYKPPIRLTKFSQSNNIRPIHELFREDGVLELQHGETVVDFEFAALDYTKPSNNRYKYKLEGVAEVWSDLGTNNHIALSHLNDGFYTLKVKGSNNDGEWSDELAIPIRVLPPIWRTWYAYLTYFVIFSAIFLILVRQQQLKIQRQLSQERKLHKLAYFDSLTGLPNRQSFYESMEKFLSLAKRGNYNAGVMFIDLDRFKRINDTLGHNFGDKVLKEVAERLRHSVRNSDFVARNYDVKSFKNEIARLGGDEFTVFLSHIDNPEETTVVTQRIIDSVSKPIMVDGYEVSVTPSIGIAMYPENGLTVQELMKHADVAMYQAKEEGRRTFKYFSNELNEKAFERLQLEEHLRNALKNQEFELYYQPQVDLFNNRIAKAEALIRWNHPVMGFVSPADFIPIAEESGLIVELGEWILQTACFQAKQWHDEGIENLKVSINVSSVQFKQTNLVDKVKNALSLTGLPSNLLELELTESAVMSDVEDNIERLQQLKNMGVTIAVDDFGTGYSSLSYLKKFPIDTLKIDRSFIMDVDQSENDAAIVKAIMLLAETMQLNVVAEGIETLEQLRVLDSYGCKYIQGYFFSRPLPVREFVDFVTEDFKEKATWKLDLIG
ncbi:EAL domain-containing protein [Psychrosphaera ytuae]|uniref:cyclic-guanylate-specific phosphodiesterase n=1 Tax=Psychrosphaera ytuae TaxID=2820710 RepID=A0A975HI06_9GAMM|nr:EAL domain-containing protein [Psychrosphaera ytuae]QTH63720.1 EAL domain-containing protein [Psychrosphaera ytuae]